MATTGKIAMQISALVVVFIFGIATGVMLVQNNPRQPNLENLQTTVKKHDGGEAVKDVKTPCPAECKEVVK